MVSPLPFSPLTTSALDLASLLTQRRTTSVQIIKACLAQIEAHNHSGLHFNACISVLSSEKALAIAQDLDTERANGKTRSKLHGIPIVVKDAFLTPPELGLATTAGAVAFKDTLAKQADGAVQRLLDAGLIVLGKANMTEFCGLKADMMTAGWSAVGGQTQSAWIDGGYKQEDSFVGRSGPGGSSSGSAVAVSAGFTPLALATETSGSTCLPANRAGVYSLKATHGRVPGQGVFPLSRTFDGVGMMARTAEDLTALAEVMIGEAMETKPQWKDIRVGFVDLDEWVDIGSRVSPDEGVTEQIRSQYDQAISKIRERGGTVVHPVPLPQTSELQYEGKSVLMATSFAQFPKLFEEHCSRLQDPPVKTIPELIEWNKQHAERAMPPPHTDQKDLEKTLDSAVSPEWEQAAISFGQNKARSLIDAALAEHKVDIIIGTGDCSLCSMAAVAGYPTAVVPQGLLHGDAGLGQPQGLMLISTGGGEEKILSFQRLWNELIGGWTVPARLR